MQSGKMTTSQAAKREWPVKLSKVLCLLVIPGVLLGLVTSLHFMDYFRDGLLQSFSGAPVQQQEHDIHVDMLGSKEYESFHHNMPDDELLWRASMVPQRPGKIPIPRTPKVAFMFLTVGPLPLAPLWERFFHGHQKLFNIYVHSQPAFEPDEAPSSVFFGRHIPSQVGRRLHLLTCSKQILDF
jgi:hypothetical protein